jgi:hypothetical protein
MLSKRYFWEGNYFLGKKKFVESIDITPEIANKLINELKIMNVEYYVAPFEADAQLMYMWKEDIADFIITEDSDLLAYGCGRVFFKFEKSGYGVEVNIRNIGKVKKMSFESFTQEDFLKTWILSGSDYTESIKGVGFKKAHKYMSKMKEKGIQHIIYQMRRHPKLVVPKDYEFQFELALLTFKYQLVYCPKREEVVHLNEPEEDFYKFKQEWRESDKKEIANFEKLLVTPRKWKELDIGKKIALSEIDPITHKPYSDDGYKFSASMQSQFNRLSGVLPEMFVHNQKFNTCFKKYNAKNKKKGLKTPNVSILNDKETGIPSGGEEKEEHKNKDTSDEYDVLLDKVIKHCDKNESVIGHSKHNQGKTIKKRQKKAQRVYGFVIDLDPYDNNIQEVDAQEAAKLLGFNFVLNKPSFEMNRSEEVIHID